MNTLAMILPGGKEAFIWSAIQREASKEKGLVILFITDAEQTICRSKERYSAFHDAFLGPLRTESQPGPLSAPSPACLPHTGDLMTLSCSSYMTSSEDMMNPVERFLEGRQQFSECDCR